jgi:hypothetical protein
MVAWLKTGHSAAYPQDLSEVKTTTSGANLCDYSIFLAAHPPEAKKKNSG